MRRIKLLVAVMAILMSFSSEAQWTQRNSLGSSPRMDAIAFSVGNKIYVGGGVDDITAFRDFWEYDPVADSWTRKADIPFFGYNGAAAFVIGNRGYISTGDRGAVGFTPSAELYEYDPAADKWTQKASLYSVWADDRVQAIGFAVGGRGYIGGGYRINTPQGGGGSSAAALYDLYEYDPEKNKWSYKTDIPNRNGGVLEGRSSAIAVTVSDFVYIGAGCDGDASITYPDFYRYNAATNDWDTLASMPAGIAEATAFALGQDIYVVGGSEFPSTAGSVTCYKYSIANDKWTTEIPFPKPVTSAVVAAAGQRAFLGTGTGDFQMGATTNEWWEFTPSVVGVQQLVQESKWNMYPNPAREVIYVSSKTAEAGMVYLYDVTGRLVLSSEISGGRSEISVAGLTKGIYVCVVNNNAGERCHVQKISKL